MSNRWTQIIILLYFFTFSVEVQAASIYEKMKKGKELYEQKKFDESLQTFVDAQIESPEDPKLKYNIASTHYKMKNYEEALKGYLDVATTAQDIQLEEKSLYNIGNVMYRQGKLEDAVEYYKKALELDPEDQDALHNLEFVREEIKRKINEAKKTAQKQQQKGKDQEQSGQDEQMQDNQSNDEQQKQPKEGEQMQEQSSEKQEQGQTGTVEEKQVEEGGRSSMQARAMTKEEAEQWLGSLQEDREKFKEKRQKLRDHIPYRSDKDW